MNRPAPQILSSTRSSRPLLVAVALSVAGLLTACASTPLRLHVPSDLAATPELQVSGRQDWSRLSGKPVVFGDYRAEEVNKGWRSTTRRRSGFGMGLAVGGTRLSAQDEQMKSRQKLEFRLVAPGASAATVQCLRAERGESVVLERQTRSTESTMRVGEGVELSLACTAEAEDGSSWTLGLNSRDPRFLSGTLTVGEKVLRLRPSREVISPKAKGDVASIPAAAGYLFETEGQTLASVELFNPSVVRIDPELPAEQRAALAGAAVALLLIGD
jgi:hypothetical protein